MGNLIDTIKNYPKKTYTNGRDFLEDNLDEIVHFVKHPKKSCTERYDLFKENLTYEKDLFKENFKTFISDSTNRKYVINEGLSILAGYSAAIAVSIHFDGSSISDEANMGINLLAKGGAYLATNILLRGGMHFKDYCSKDKSFKDDVSVLLSANKDGFLISYTLKSVFYLGLLKSDLVSATFLPIVAYPLAGLIGFVFKQKKTHKNGLFDLSYFKNRKKKSDLEDKLLEKD